MLCNSFSGLSVLLYYFAIPGKAPGADTGLIDCIIHRLWPLERSFWAHYACDRGTCYNERSNGLWESRAQEAAVAHG